MQHTPRSFTRGLCAITVATAVAVTGCANMSETQQDSAKGAGIGAAAGAVLGALTGGSKGAARGAVIGAGAGALGGYIWSTRMQEQKRQMEAATAGTGIGVSQTADNRLKLDVPADAGFATGRSALSPTLTRVLGQFATTLQQNQVTQVAIVGHTDSTGSDAINNPLSFDRANATRDYLVSRGVSAARIATDGRGSREPVADNGTDAGRAANRRVEIYVAEPATTAQR
ncbi:MAG: OmpA family protein [Hydrogenophaga sp.]|nr:OmpA family protein [Hydrogenophaga sp.]